MRVYSYTDIEVTKLVSVGPIDLQQYFDETGDMPNVFSFELEASSGVAIDSGVVFTFQVSNDAKVWRTIDGATTTQTGAGMTHRVQLPPVRYLRATVTTRGSTANQRGDVTIVLAQHPYMPT